MGSVRRAVGSIDAVIWIEGAACKAASPPSSKLERSGPRGRGGRGGRQNHQCPLSTGVKNGSDGDQDKSDPPRPSRDWTGRRWNCAKPDVASRRSGSPAVPAWPAPRFPRLCFALGLESGVSETLYASSLSLTPLDCLDSEWVANPFQTLDTACVDGAPLCQPSCGPTTLPWGCSFLTHQEVSLCHPPHLETFPASRKSPWTTSRLSSTVADACQVTHIRAF